MKNDFDIKKEWSENVIIADADYVDRVAFNLTVNFERMLGRRIPAADMARWTECIALDGGVRQSEQQQETSVILVHNPDKEHMQNFVPASFSSELNGKAFMGALGEFVINAIAVDKLTTKTDLLVDLSQLVLSQKDVRRVMIIPNTEDGDAYGRLCVALRQADDEKRITMFAMQPMPGGNFRQEILGYSLMSALGIRGDELKWL